MSEYAQNFVAYLQSFTKNNQEKNLGALARLRRSLCFPPGAYIPAFSYVERFIASGKHEQDASRRALYLVAGLFALHPKHGSESLAASFGMLMRKRKRNNSNIEHRFICLLGANAQSLPNYLRQVVSLLRSEGLSLNYAALIGDLNYWLNPHVDPQRRDQIRQRWARDFYRVTTKDSPEETASEPVSITV